MINEEAARRGMLFFITVSIEIHFTMKPNIGGIPARDISRIEISIEDLSLFLFDVEFKLAFVIL